MITIRLGVNGRLKTKRIGAHTVQHFSYNIEHQLVEVLIEKQGVAPKIVRYQYDALGRRIAKHDANDSTWFIWDGLQLLQETRNHALVTYVYAPDSDEALARIEDTINDAHWREEEQRHNQIYYFHPHINGAPEEMTSSGGQVVWQARYKVWGALLQETDGPYRNPSPEGKDYHPLPQNLRFQGQYFDAETGLHYNTFRYYDPDVGRFTTEDPIGLNGGLNLYQYAPNPFGWIDPWGLEYCKKTESWSAKPSKAWRNKVVGRAQATKTPGHRFASYREAIKAAKNSSVKKVYLDRGYNRVLGPKTLPRNRRPDVLVEHKSGKLDAIEIKSKSDDIFDLRSRNDIAMEAIPKGRHSAGTVRAFPPT